MKRIYSMGYTLILCLMWGIGSAPTAHTATIAVTGTGSAVADDGKCTLVEAILAANEDSASGYMTGECPAGDGADVIELSGDVTLTDIADHGEGDNGLPRITSEIVVNGNGATIRRDPSLFPDSKDPCSRFDADEFLEFRIFHIAGTGRLSLNGVTVRDGCSNGGGGIFNEGTVTITDSTIANNRARKRGGGILNTGSMTLETVIIRNNTAGGKGGGIGNLGTISINESTVRRNKAAAGGGIFNGKHAGATLCESTLSSNEAAAFGGGVENCGALTLTNSTVSGNTAHESGGGLHNKTEFATATLTNSTVARNSGPTVTNDSGGSVSLKNTIIAGSVSGGDCSGPVTSKGHNLDSDGSCGLDPALSDLPGKDPRLGRLRDNGGPTFTHALLPGSPAIDAGDDDGCPATDQRGIPRPLDGNGDGIRTCDVGAYEFRALPFQPNTAGRRLPAAGDFPQNPRLAYVLTGSPIRPPDPDPLAVLQVLGPPDIFLWRLFRFFPIGQRLGEFSNGGAPGFSFEQGRGFWLITRDGATLDISGERYDASSPFRIRLRPGFNQIATPFNFLIDWTGCVAPSLPAAISPTLLGFDGEKGGFVDVTLDDGIMRPMFGYFVAADSRVTLSISPDCAQQEPTAVLARSMSVASRIATPRVPGTAEGWRLKLSAAVGPTSDRDNYLGVDAASLDGKDGLDYPEPPPMHGLSLSFPHPEWSTPFPHYAADIRGLSSEGSQVWNFQVMTDFPEAQVRLNWKMRGNGPETLTLRDLDANRVVRMGRKGGYTYRTRQGGIRHFQVTAK